ncbi:hypothetical protein ACFL2T_06125, partial [Elusimicrobiota bacterium]
AATRMRAAAYQGLDECGSALEILGPLSRERDWAALALRDKGVCEHKLGMDRSAIRDLEAALRRDPGLLSAYLTLGAIHISGGRKREALRTYERALRNSIRPEEARLRELIERARNELR